MGDTLLILGIGNSLRRDDGAGLLLAAALAETWQSGGYPVRLLTTHQLAPEHAEDITAPDVAAVLFVDVEVGIDTPRCTPIAAAGESSPAGGHTLGAATVLLYAQTLSPTPPPAWLLTIPACDLDHGEGLSPATQAHLDQVVAGAVALWTRLSPTPL